MKIKTFSEATGISLARIYRAMPEVLSRTGCELSKGGRYGGTELTVEQQTLLKKMLPLEKPVPPPTYEMLRQSWQETWTDGYKAARNVFQKRMIAAVIGALILAKDKAWLFQPCEEVREGDFILELAFAGKVDFEEPKLSVVGFTRFLIDQGFESPGWNIS